jgi:hypothetical protein
VHPASTTAQLPRNLPRPPPIPPATEVLVSSSQIVCFYLLVAVFSGITCAIIASRKNRSPTAWFFLGCLMMIGGIIDILVLNRGDRRKPAADSAAPPPSESSLDTLRQLAELRDRGALSAADFEQKKRDILARL